MLVLEILGGLIILVILVVAHELGHGIVARRNGVIVEEFGIGFPPKAWGKIVKRSILGKNVLFTLNWLPLGGFVRLKGEHDAARKKGEYGASTYWQKTKILLAGVVMNWVIAIVLLTILALFGLPKILPNQFSVSSDTKIINKPLEIVSIVDGSPAMKAGLKSGDQLLRLDGIDLKSDTSLVNLTKQNHGTRVELIYQRAGVEHITHAVLQRNDTNNKGYLGVSVGQQQLMRATWSAPIVGVATTVQFTWLTLTGTVHVLGQAITGVVQSLSFNHQTHTNGATALQQVSASVAGPVGILGIIFPAAEKAGLGQLLFLTAIISLSLAVMNILPIPALDGGRWFVMTIYRLMKKQLTKEREEKIQTAGFMVLMALVLLVTWADVAKIIH